MMNTALIYLAGALIIMTPNSLQILIADSSDETRWQEYKSQSFTSNIKRHSEGTYTSDLTRYLDKMKAKDFVQWLMNKKRSSSMKRFFDRDLMIAKLPSDISMLRYN